MTYDTDVPTPTSIIGLIRDLPPKQSVYIPRSEAQPGSVRTIVSRVRAEFRSRAFVTAKEGHGLRVWRTA